MLFANICFKLNVMLVYCEINDEVYINEPFRLIVMTVWSKVTDNLMIVGATPHKKQRNNEPLCIYFIAIG